MTKAENQNNHFFFPFPEPLVTGKIINRYKRFLADIKLDSGEKITAHVANSGSMTTCWEPGARVVLTREPENTTRKLKYSLQAVNMADGWIGVNTMNPNKAVFQAIKAKKIDELSGYRLIQSEIKTDTGSRFDLAIFNELDANSCNHIAINQKRMQVIDQNCHETLPACLVEIKNATLKEKDGVIFPDAVTTRGQKHLLHLVEMKKLGFRAIILFFAGRNNANWVGPADSFDPTYGKLLRASITAGVEAIALKILVNEKGLTIAGTIPVLT